MKFELKRVSGKSILFVMAAEAEYGPFLRSRIDPLMTGVGPVEAAIALTRAFAQLEAQGDLPDLVVSLGSAGSAKLEQTEVYQVTSVSYRDMDASPLGFERGETPFLGLPAILKPGPLIPGLPSATLSTGADVISGADYDFIDADMVDMESYAVLRACQLFELPLVVLRGVSDGDKGLREVADWTRYLDVIDGKLAEAVDRLEAAFAAGRLEAGRRG